MRCPISCRKVKELKEAKEWLEDFCSQLIRERKKGEKYKRDLDCLGKLSEMGYHLLSHISKDGRNYVVVMEKYEAYTKVIDSIRTAYLFEIPKCEICEQIGRIHFHYCENCSIYIDDFLMSIEDVGYGTMLLESIISFARASGFQHIRGIISPVDFSREDKLRHFYSKFGFEITDRQTCRGLHLNLNGDQGKQKDNKGNVYCNRQIIF